MIQYGVKAVVSIKNETMAENELRILQSLMERVKEDSGFMAYALDIYRRQQGLDENGLVAQLNTTLESIVRLALCKKPDPSSPKFAEQLQQIANYTAISQTLIIDVLKASEGLAAERAVTAGGLPVASLYAVLLGLYKRTSRRARRLTPRSAYVALALLMLAVIGYWAYKWFLSPPQPEETIATMQNEHEHPHQVEPPANKDEIVNARPNASQSDASDSPTKLRPKGRKSDVDPVPVEQLKLSEIVALRDADEKRPENRGDIKLHRRLNRLQIELLQGSDAGAYDVRIKGLFGESLLSARSISSDGKFLRVNLDLRALDPGHYYLCLSQAGGIPDCYSLLIEP